MQADLLMYQQTSNGKRAYRSIVSNGLYASGTTRGRSMHFSLNNQIYWCQTFLVLDKRITNIKIKIKVLDKKSIHKIITQSNFISKFNHHLYNLQVLGRIIKVNEVIFSSHIKLRSADENNFT